MLTETRVDVGGYRLALYCRGSGTPAVVLDAGAGADASSWAHVQPAVATFTRVCAFDRPGRGQSDSAPQPDSVQQMVDEVHSLLVHAGVPGPYVLVGHSSGSLNMRRYALQYPNDVAGLVLVDAVHPDQFVRAAALLPPEVAEEDAGLHAFREALRALNRPDVEAASHSQEPEPGMNGGMSGSLGALPLLVLTATQHDLGVPAAVLAPLEQDWQAMQHDMSTLSDDGVQIIADGSGHHIHLEHPALVVDAIRRVVEAVRWHRPLKAPA